MKKAVSLYSTLIVLLCAWGGALLAGCETDDSPFTGPKDKWCEKEFMYENEGTQSTLTLYLYYTDSSSYSGAVNADIKEKIKAGLTIVAIPATDSPLFQTFGANKYAVYNLPKNEKIADDNSSNTVMSDIIWNAFCLANPTMTSEATSIIPYPLKQGHGYSSISNLDEIKEQFSIKKLLMQLLINQL